MTGNGGQGGQGEDFGAELVLVLCFKSSWAKLGFMPQKREIMVICDIWVKFIMQFIQIYAFIWFAQR